MPYKTSKRVRTIYSVIASSNRLDILRILNSKGPLSYSELKTLAGFKSKKESGKFAYHLRKLVKQMLVTLNRSERRYNVTNLGRLILNLTRQIEEQSVIESGKIYVRTSKEMMEEFKPDKILQALVKEAGMPVDLAQKMTSEAEARLYKFQTSYLTAPLIREIVNALLIEHGYEEYRHKLTRIGLPIHDVTQMLKQSTRSDNGVSSLVTQTSKEVFSEYLLLNQLSRDVTDAHLSGDIHISNLGVWGLKPDTIFVNLSSLPTQGIKVKGKLLSSVKINKAENFSDSIANMVLLTTELSKEINVEIAYNNFIDYITSFVDNKMSSSKDSLIQMFKMISQVVSDDTSPFVSINLNVQKNSKIDDKQLTKLHKLILESYEEYIQTIAIPKITLILPLSNSQNTEISKKVFTIIKKGGYIAINADTKNNFSYTGINKSMIKNSAGGNIILHAVSINLPRLAYESNKDDTYFRAKVNLILKTAISALSTRREIIDDMTGKGLLPLLNINTGIISSQKIPLVINFTGLDEAIYSLLGTKSSSKERGKLAGKIIDTAMEEITNSGKRLGEEFGLSSIVDDSAKRFADIDIEKFGKARVINKANSREYQQSIILDLDEQEKIDEMNGYISKFKGGYSVYIDTSNSTIKNFQEMTNKISKKVGFFKYHCKLRVCISCAYKNVYNTEKCSNCNSTSLQEYPVN
ncbi:MAG: helix-turn-helix domain-containing protein [Nitrososphaerales archaeon]|nr:helix-turn-helix domain-containing protein [Nitrososphaerales archaeon]